MKRIFVFVLSLILFGGVLTSVKAQEKITSQTFNSFEVFWPISAGKVMGDSLYSLKSFKESLRGLLLFGQSKKADYNVFLAIKRTVEAESLLVKGENELASQTLDKMNKRLDIAKQAIAKSKGMSSELTSRINTRLDNLELFLSYLASKNEPVKEKLQSVLEAVKELNRII